MYINQASFSQSRSYYSFRENRTEFLVVHHLKAIETLISLIYWVCDFKVLFGFLFYIGKSCPLLAANSKTLSYYSAKTEAVIAFWHEYYVL